MAKTGDDCYFFYNQTCIKGELCPYRHVEEAKGSTVTCDKWRMHLCKALPCPLRHMELQQNVPCFYETQPGGCTRPNCVFRHKFSKQQTAPPGPVPVSVAPVPARNILQRPPVSAGPVPVIYNRPPPPPRPGWQGAGIGPAQMFPGPPITRPPPGFPPFHPGASLPPASVPLMQIDPVIINPNEESDQDSIKGSPMKVVTRVQPTVPPHTQIQSSNPLDYFLNAKPWVDTSQRNVYRRSPSPILRRSRSKSPRRSLSPRRSVSPRRSQSPTPVSRQRSLSAERYSSSIRRRSGSLDRSRSPEWRDSRRFGRRSSRSPPRRRSRSPNRDRERGILNKFRQGGRGRKLQEVKVTGSKIISIKKDKKQEKEEEEEKEKQTEKKEEKVDKVKSDRSKVVADIVKEDVKSLEDIYRERALQSLMDAKRKKILENKRKRWENVGAKKVSESEKSDKSGKQSGDDEDQSNVDEKGDNKNEEVDSSSDSADEGGDNKSDIDLPDDIDIEIGEGDLEDDNESEKSESDKESEHDKREEDLPVKHKIKSKSSVSIPEKA
ncbi:uncharacterized protein DDB_G0284459-like [Ruditapes philippinarum]|uniref:uncharacterized protein DDB_G0284459-like n=1 Tax=Ruditapes philippinarum TaxID=129788 RepID=UPI00295A76BD|nr:uncharacterized protein DDB_G0284459-like [Ruditapes philippinarum]